MKKNGFFTFCFAFVPGAGQMYQGYMKRGLSLIGICCVAVIIGSLFQPLVAAAMCICCVAWMYSFFDTFNLRAMLSANMPPEDDYLIHLGHDVTLDQLLHRRHKLFGWCLVAVGVYTLYDELVMDFLRELYWNTNSSWIIRVIYNIMNEVPTVVICLAVIALGIWLVRGPRNKPSQADPFDQLEEFCEYGVKEEESHDGEEN
ncbi:hypothetical protein [Faecalibacterium sp. An122]|uniref:hypothetical protein n=1 Tax=Faecalibacterium sp. An122 TaxID=1965551 RepID=UPI000B3AF34B|nr:hypothetical protein [Faecalibacterium sp. An122]OUQ37580.1 hypothetical protein B5E67_07670 [Faecalibacterium sp. An122]